MKIPTVSHSFRPLQDFLLKKAEANILLAALEMDIFSFLVTPTSAGEVAGLLHLDIQNTRVLLNALAACDLIDTRKGLFRNSPLAQEYLVRGSDTYLGDYLRSCDPWYALSTEKICSLVKNGPSASDNPFTVFSPEFWEMQTRGTLYYQRSGMAQLLVKLISSLPEYSRLQSMLDLGCGPGILGIALVMDHPAMRCVLFDRPLLTPVIEECVRTYSVHDRVTILSGDYITDSIGDGYDLILASMTLNFALDSIDDLMSKMYGSLHPGGLLVTLSDARKHEGTKPEEMVIPMLLPELTGCSIAIQEEMIANTMLKAGFSSVRSKPVESPVGELEFTIGRR